MEKPSEETMMTVVSAVIILIILILVIILITGFGPENIFSIMQDIFGGIYIYLIIALKDILRG